MNQFRIDTMVIFTYTVLSFFAAVVMIYLLFAFIEWRRRKQAINQIKKFIFNDGPDWRVHFLCWYDNLRSGNLPQALDAFQKAMEGTCLQERTNLWNLIGKICASRKFHAPAFNFLRHAVTIYPDEGGAWHQYSLALYRNRLFEQALEASDRAINFGSTPEAQPLNEHLRRRLAKRWAPEGA